MNRTSQWSRSGWALLAASMIAAGSAPSRLHAQPDDDARSEVHRLWIQASDGAVRHRDLVQPSKDSLIAMGEAVIPDLLSYLHTEDARERHTITDLFQGIGSPAVPYLTDVLGTGGEYHTGNTLWALGKIGDSTATLAMAPFLQDDLASVRSRAAESIGKCAGATAMQALWSALADTVEDVRKSAVVGLGRVRDPEAADALLAALDDPWFGVRYAAAEALVVLDSGTTASRRIDQLDHRALALVVGALARLGNRTAQMVSWRLLNDDDYRVRAAAYRGMAEVDLDRRSRFRIESLLEQEESPLVRYHMQRLLHASP